MGFTGLTRKSLMLLFMTSISVLITHVGIVGANPVPDIFYYFSKESIIVLVTAVFGVFLFNYFVNLGSAALIFKVFGFVVDTNSITKLAVAIFKVTIAGAFVGLLIHGSLGFMTYGLVQYGISAIFVAIVEIILLSLLLHGLGLRYKKAISVSVCAIVFGALIGLPFVLIFSP